jgi:predicted NAD/FAD-binding protein
VVLAVHSDQALRLLAQPSAAEQVLGAIRYQPNRAVLHTDTRVMPSAAPPGRPGTTSAQPRRTGIRPRLPALLAQPPAAAAVCAAGAGVAQPGAQHRPAQVLGEFDYDHPVFDLGALAAQQLPLQGAAHLVCGAWTGYGFHEDGLQSATAPPMRCWRNCAGGRPHDHRCARPGGQRAAHRLWPCVAHPAAPAPPPLHRAHLFLLLPMRSCASGPRQRACWR